jgi:hypothetical protein
MSAMTRLASRSLTAAAVGVAVVGLAAGVSAYAAPAGPPPPPHQPAEACHIDWFTHPSGPGQFGAAISIDTRRVFPNWLLTFGFKGAEQVDGIWAGPIDFWHQDGSVVTVKGDRRLRDLPVGQDVLGLPLTIIGTPSGTPWFALNGRPCSVTATTAIPPTTTTTTTTTTTHSSSTTSTTSPPDSGGCTATYRVLWQTANQFQATVSWSGSTSLYTSTTLRVDFSGDQQVTQLTPDHGPDATWTQSGQTLTVSGYPSAQNQAATFTATYSGVNGAPLSVGAGFSCRTTFYPAAGTTSTTWAGGTTTTTSTWTTPNDSCSARHQIIWQTATQFSARVSYSGTSTLYSSGQLRFVFSGDQQVTSLTPEQGPDATWTQTGNEVVVTGYPSSGSHAASFLATYSGTNGPPTFVGAGFSCAITFLPAQTMTTTYASIT